MKIDEKYYGEVWLPENEDSKSFCMLEVIDYQITLTTNLFRHSTEYKIDKILGQFNDLGALTLVNNKIRKYSSGYIRLRVYEPEFTFISTHFIKTESLKLKEFVIKNSAYNSWISQIHLFNSKELNIKSKNEDVKEIVEVNDKKLKIQISKALNSVSNETKTEIINCGYVAFDSENEISILEAIELYNTFQKFILFTFGKSPQFEFFKFKCLNCDEDVSVYYKDRLSNTNSSNFLHFDFFEIRNSLSNILPVWYTNQDIEFCANFVLENKLSQKISHSRRFVNSIFSFEAYYKRFHSGDNSVKNNKLNNSLTSRKEIILELTELPDEEFKNFVQKIIRSRDYYVHGNLKQKNIFSEFELLYISFLLDFIVGIQIINQLGFEESLIEKAKSRAKSTYVDMQWVNKMLNQNVFLKNITS